MRIVVGEFILETNSFCPVHTTIEDFALRGIYEGSAMRHMFGNIPCALGGMLTALDEAGAETVLSCAMTAQSGGIVEHAVVDTFLHKVLTVIQENQPLDGVFLSCHGATQTTAHDDGVGFILETIRNYVGVRPVIAISTDLHANVTPKMVQNADIICGYHTYPHVDFFETGCRAAKLGLACCEGGAKRPVMAFVSVPMIAPASAYTTSEGPFAALVKDAEQLQESGEILDFSIYQMQPWLDVSQGGSSVLVVAENGGAAKRRAYELAKRLFAIRRNMTARPMPINEIIVRAAANTKNGPVVLADSADSSNAGAAGDSAEVLRCLLSYGKPLKAALIVNDAGAADQAHALGVGKQADFTLGGSIDPKRSNPVSVHAYVRSLHDGEFVQEGPAGRGILRKIGPTAVLRVGEIDVIVCHSMTGNGDPQLFRAFGVEPTLYRLVSVKACTSFRAAYEAFAADICEADTPGSATAVLASLPFRRLPAYFYPFDDIADWEPAPAVLAREKQ